LLTVWMFADTWCCILLHAARYCLRNAYILLQKKPVQADVAIGKSERQTGKS